MSPRITLTATRMARKRHICERTVHMRFLESKNVPWESNPELYGRPCVKEDQPIQPGERYIETEGWDEFHPSRYHVECWEDEA